MWLNFYDYTRTRENQTIYDRIIAKGCIETDIEQAVYDEMAKIQVKYGEEGKQSEIIRTPLIIDVDDIRYLSQFMLGDWSKAFAYKYNDWLAECAKSKEEKNELKVQDWIFLPLKDRVYFIYIGGMEPYHKLDAEPNDEHFSYANGGKKERKRYSNSFQYPNNGLYGYDLSDPKFKVLKGENEFDYQKEKVTDKEEIEPEKKVEPGEKIYVFGTPTSYTGLSQKIAITRLTEYLKNTALGWNTFSKVFSGNELSENEKEKFRELPQVRLPKVQGRPSREDPIIPIYTESMINLYNNNPITGNDARMRALMAIDEQELNSHDLTKDESNKNFRHISTMKYDVHIIDKIPKRVYPVIPSIKTKRISNEEVFPYMPEQRIIQRADWEKVEPKTANFYDQPAKVEPLYQKMAAIRNGLWTPETFFEEVRNASPEQVKDKEKEIAIIREKTNDDRVLKPLGDELAGILVKLELDKQRRQKHIHDMDTEGFVNVAKEYLQKLLEKNYNIISTIKTGDAYDVNIRRRQAHYEKEHDIQTFNVNDAYNTFYNPNKSLPGGSLSTQEYTDYWFSHLIHKIGEGRDIEHQELHSVEPFDFEKEALDQKEAEKEIQALKHDEDKLAKQLASLPPGNSKEHKSLKLKLGRIKNKIYDAKLHRTGTFTISPLAQGIRNYINNLRSKGGINQLKAETLNDGFMYVMMGAKRRISRQLGTTEFVEFKKAEEQLKEAEISGDEGRKKKALANINEKLKKLKKFAWLQGQRYATLMWQLSLAGEGTRREISRYGAKTISAEAGEQEDDSIGLIDLIVAKDEAEDAAEEAEGKIDPKQHLAYQTGYEEEPEEPEKKADPFTRIAAGKTPMMKSPEAKRELLNAAVQSERRLKKAQKKHGLDFIDLAVGTNLARISLNLAKRRQMLQDQGLSEEEIEEDIERLGKQLKLEEAKKKEQKDIKEREEMEKYRARLRDQGLNEEEIDQRMKIYFIKYHQDQTTKELEELKTQKREEKEEKSYREKFTDQHYFRGSYYNVKDILEYFEKRYHQILFGFDASLKQFEKSGHYNELNAKPTIQALEELERESSSQLGDIELRRRLQMIKQRYDMQITKVYLLASLLDPKLLQKSPEVHSDAEQVVTTRRPDGSSVYKGYYVSPQLVEVIIKALNLWTVQKQQNLKQA